MDNIFANLMVNGGLYDRINVTKDNLQQLIDLVSGEVRIDVYCTKCKEKRVFSMMQSQVVDDDSENKKIKGLGDAFGAIQHKLKCILTPRPNGGTESSECPDNFIKRELRAEHIRVFVLKYYCAMDDTHRLDYTFVITDGQLIKIGQYPSVADLCFRELDQYKKVLSKDDMKELRRAIGLYAQGIGIGSYVYLRRILERLIEKAKDEALTEGKLDSDEYKNAKVPEKIRLLRDYLPDVLVKNTQIYGIISAGVHALTEEECMKYFPILKSSIVMILNMWEQNRKQKEEEKQMNASLSQIATELS